MQKARPDRKQTVIKPRYSYGMDVTATTSDGASFGVGDRFKATSPRDALIQSMVGRFYVNEQATLVSNGLSTDVLCFPSDLHPSRSAVLKNKITDAISYATAFGDVRELNALFRMAPPEKQDGYLTLGLFLYLEDECNRLGKKTTFLTAMREGGVNLDKWSVYDRKPYLQKAMKALRELGMDESYADLLHSWFKKGSYELHGELHCCEGEELVGTYAELASRISHEQEKLGMNKAISYALANKEHMQRLSPEILPPEEALAMTKELLTEQGGRTIKNRIKRGDGIREQRIKDAIRGAGMQAPSAVPEKSRKDAEAILSFLPDQALEILYREGYMFGYGEGNNIGGCYPQKDLPDVTEKRNEDFRLGKALWFDRYRMVFLSDGKRVSNDLEGNPGLRHQVVGQSLAHETMHLILSYLSDEERLPLIAAVTAASEELKSRKDTLPEYAVQKLHTVDTNTLAEAMDYTSRLYVNYGKLPPDTRWQEVACNAFGLLHAEYPDPAQNPFLHEREGLKSLPALKQEMEKALELALAKCREEFSTVEIPSPQQGRT